MQFTVPGTTVLHVIQVVFSILNHKQMFQTLQGSHFSGRHLQIKIFPTPHQAQRPAHTTPQSRCLSL